MSELKPPLFQRMLTGYYAKIEAGFAIEKILGWEWDSIAGLSFDYYDESFEIYAPEDCADCITTDEQHAAIMALGCQRYWINFSDGTERYGRGGERQKNAGGSRWRQFDEGERLERRQIFIGLHQSNIRQSALEKALPPNSSLWYRHDDGMFDVALRSNREQMVGWTLFASRGDLAGKQEDDN